jgi:hypothetical protein
VVVAGPSTCQLSVTRVSSLSPLHVEFSRLHVKRISVVCSSTPTHVGVVVQRLWHVQRKSSSVELASALEIWRIRNLVSKPVPKRCPPRDEERPALRTWGVTH